MPWCEACSRFLTPTSLGEAGECPSCGRVVATAGPAGEGADPVGAHGDGEPKAPWHFKLLVLATVLYLAYRAVQGVLWVAGRL